jgi:hypothetical protein
LKDVRPEILRLVIDDQWDRGNDMFGGRQVRAPDTLDWQAISERDEQRQSAIRALLAKGQVETGREYHFAALVFQHSSSPEALVLAHVLAVTAIIQGDSSAKWLAAATLDRYLQNDKQPQVFGTQFLRHGDNMQWTMQPYNRAAVPDDVAEVVVRRVATGTGSSPQRPSSWKVWRGQYVNPRMQVAWVCGISGRDTDVLQEARRPHERT